MTGNGGYGACAASWPASARGNDRAGMITRMTEGINAASVTAWLTEHIEGVRAPFTFELISGGRSNLTFAVTDAAGRRLVLRRPPMSHVLPTAHDMGREYRIISALRPTDRMPQQHGPAIVHGDYRIDNTVISADGRVQAVLDWELCTLGDALADVGTLMAYWSDHAVAEMAEAPADAGAPEFGATAQLAATALPGFPSRAEVAERYAERSGRDLTELGFYVPFAYWKLACILHAVYVRHAD